MSAESAHGSHSNHQLVGVQGLEYGVSQEGLVLVEAHRREERDQLQRPHQHPRSPFIPAVRQHSYAEGEGAPFKNLEDMYFSLHKAGHLR